MVSLLSLAAAAGSSIGKGDQRNLPATIGFAPVGCPAVAEETVRVGISVEAQRLDPLEARRREARNDKALQIELVMAGSTGAEESFERRIFLRECREEGIVDFVGSAGDGRSDRGADRS